MLQGVILRRTIIAIAATAMVGITFASTEADARRGGGGGLRGGGGFSRGAGIRGGGLRGGGLRTASIRGRGIRTAALGRRVDIGRPGRPDLGRLAGRRHRVGRRLGRRLLGQSLGLGSWHGSRRSRARGSSRFVLILRSLQQQLL